jgi:hypothetical protein
VAQVDEVQGEDDEQAQAAIPDDFKTKPNLDRKASEPDPELPRHLKSNMTSDTAANGVKQGDIGSSVSVVSSGSMGSKGSDKKEVVVLKDLDCRGEEDGCMWWECAWEAMDGIGGTNKKGKRCFDRVRIYWKDIQES